MSSPGGRERKLKPHEEARAALERHYLLGPVARSFALLPLGMSAGQAGWPSGAYCRITGVSRV